MSVWTIEVDGEIRTPAGWEIDWDSFQSSFNSWQPDTCSFAMTKATVLEDPIFAFRDPITVKKDGVTWFVGRLYKLQASASSPKELQRYIARNVWQDLETLVLEQDRHTALASESFLTLHRVPVTKLILASRMSDIAGIQKIDTKQTITDILDYAIAEGLELQYNVDFTPITPPYEEGNNLTAAAAMRRMAGWTPDAATRWDYSTTPPTLYIRRRATETPISLDLLDSATNGLVNFPNIDADDDLVPSGVELTIQGAVNDPITLKSFVTLDRHSVQLSGGSYIAGQLPASPDRARLIRGTIPLAGYDSVDGETGLASLAEDFANALKERFWNAELNFKAREVPGTFRPGKLINFINGQTAWATAKAIAQSVTEIPATGETVVRCGRPPWLAKGTLDEINKRIADIRNPNNSVSTYYSGYTSTPDKETYESHRVLTFNLTGYNQQGSTQWAGSATFEVDLTSRVTFNIKLTSFAAHQVASGISYGLAFWDGYDSTGGPMQAGFAGAIGVQYTGLNTGTFKIRFVMNGPVGPEWITYDGTISATYDKLLVSVNASP